MNARIGLFVVTTALGGCFIPPQDLADGDSSSDMGSDSSSQGTAGGEDSDTRGDASSGSDDTASNDGEDPTTGPTTSMGDSMSDPTDTADPTDTDADGGTGSDTDDPPPPPAEYDFFDDFEREDGDALGGGWIERDPTAWRLLGGEVAATNPAGEDGSFADTLFHRPDGESTRDLELSVEFRVMNADARNEIVPAVRLQPPSTGFGEELTGYLVTPLMDSTPPQLCILRFVQALFPDAGTPSCAPFEGGSLDLGERYRMTLRAEGDAPVELLGRLERATGEDAWEPVVEVAWTDDSTRRIPNAGVWGIAGGGGRRQIPNYRLDDVGMVELTR